MSGWSVLSLGMSSGEEADRGEATIEFLAVVMILVVPVFYLIMTLGTLQGAIYASDSAARSAARILAEHPFDRPAAALQAQLAFADYHLDLHPSVSIDCSPVQCVPGTGMVNVRVAVSVPLPFLPQWLSDTASIPIDATANMPIAGVEIR